MKDFLALITSSTKAKTAFCLIIGIPIAALVLFLNFRPAKEVHTETTDAPLLYETVEGDMMPEASTTSSTTTTSTTVADTTQTEDTTTTTTTETTAVQ